MDYSKLTDSQINEMLMPFRFDGLTKVNDDPDGYNFKYNDCDNHCQVVDSINDDGFCLRIVKENEINVLAPDNLSEWVAYKFEGIPNSLNRNRVGSNSSDSINRAILICYLKIKD